MIFQKQEFLKRFKKPEIFPCAYLIVDNWNDWGYCTLFNLIVWDNNNDYHEIGYVKIAQSGMGSKKSGLGYHVKLPDIPFDKLGKDFFSLGQGDGYYDRMKILGKSIRVDILKSLHDMAYNLKLFDKYKAEPVTQTSLLRGIDEREVRRQFHRIAKGGQRLTPYRFKYYIPPFNCDEGESPSSKREWHRRLEFEVEPDAIPPTNVHVLIGRNSVGKTFIMSNLAKDIICDDNNYGRFQMLSTKADDNSFANVVAVSFSPFESVVPIHKQDISSSNVSYHYIGIKSNCPYDPGKNITEYSLKSLDTLREEFKESFKKVSLGIRSKYLFSAVATLSSDPLFESLGFEATIQEVLRLAPENKGEADAKIMEKISTQFHNLSSGHKIVLLTIVKLVELVEEKSLVLMDEPELHLHPPLLASMIRAVSELLIKRNGMAVIATHSPVVLQEVPRKCVWAVSRSGEQVKVERPESETFGENVGILTKDVFKLEVEKSGFYRFLKEKISPGQDYDQVVNEFEDQLGGEAKGLVMLLTMNRQQKRGGES